MPEKKTEKPSEAAADTKKKKPPMMMIVAVVALVVLVGGFVAGKSVSAKSGPEKPKKAEPGPVVPLDEFLVNLADPGGDHFLKVSVNLEMTKASGKTPESVKEQVPLIRDAVLTALTSRTRDDLAPQAGRDKLKADIKKKVNAALGEDDVQSVYFTNFVTN